MSAQETANTAEPFSKELIEETWHCLELILVNKFEDAEALLSKKNKESPYHALGLCYIQCLRALLTFDPADLGTANTTLDDLEKYSSNLRKKKSNVVASAFSFLSGGDKAPLTRNELHAELMHAECGLLKTLLIFLEQDGLMTFVKGTLNVNNCYNTYQRCHDLLKEREKARTLASAGGKLSKTKEALSLQERDPDFESGVLFGAGSFNMGLSLLPPRILALIEFLGFSGDRKEGLAQLEVGASGGLRSAWCRLMILFYHSVISGTLGLKDASLDYAQESLNPLLVKYPEGSIFLYIQGRIYQSRGQFKDAVASYQKSIDVQQYFKQIHSAAHWEMIWCNAFGMDWYPAYECANQLYQASKWSKGFLVYVAGIMLYEVEGPTERVIELINKAPTLYKKFAGKSIPAEKYALQKVKKFVSQGNRLYLPGIELVYLHSGFRLMGRELLESTLQIINDNPPNPEFVEDEALACLLKAAILRELGRDKEAEPFLKQLLSYEKKIKNDIYMLPWGRFELSRIMLKHGRKDLCNKQIDAIKSKYEEYGLESRLHLAIHVAQLNSKVE